MGASDIHAKTNTRSDLYSGMSGSHAIFLAEYFSKVAAAAKAGFHGDLHDAFFGVYQQVPGSLEPDGDKVFHRGHAKVGFKKTLR